MLNLEHLFAEIKRSLKRGGSFVISDMIGRNGHRRWPEALVMVREFWRKLPPSYRFNEGRLRYEETYDDHDCSGDSFEGIRAQDILPLLLEHFHFELFIAFASLIDPFIDRNFGNNFDAAVSWDRSSIDQVNERDEKEIASGHIKPTHLLAVMRTDSSVPTLFHEPLSPQFCVRDPSVREDEAVFDDAAHAWPHSDGAELEIACRRLKEAQDRTAEQANLVKARTQWALRLEQELAKRTVWAQQLDREAESADRRIDDLQVELANRTAWAQRLDRELEEDRERLARARAVDRPSRAVGLGL